MWFLISFVYAQTFTGGLGVGALTGIANLPAITPGYVATGSIEIQEFTSELPGFGAGIETELGFAPKTCTRCQTAGIARLGIGPIFRRGRSFTMVGIRGSVLGQRQAFRPFAMSKMQLPVAGLVFRPFAWIEGLTATELGVGLELGFKISKEGKFIIRDVPPGRANRKANEEASKTEAEEPESTEPLPDIP